MSFKRSRSACHACWVPATILLSPTGYHGHSKATDSSEFRVSLDTVGRIQLFDVKYSKNAVCVQVYDIERKTLCSYDSYMVDQTSSKSLYTSVMERIGYVCIRQLWIAIIVIWFMFCTYREVLTLIYEEGYVQHPCKWRLQAKLVWICICRVCLQSKITLLKYFRTYPSNRIVMTVECSSAR